MQMAQKGKRLESGENINFLYINAEHKNPFRRVVPAAILDENHKYYDQDKYAELVLDLAETILGIFGFERKQLRIGPKSRNYLDELRFERSKERLTELESLMESIEWD